jgi:aspartate carbamoyltransferase catalytic subunit
MRHILSARQFEQGELACIFDKADDMRQRMSDMQARRELAQRHVGAIAATLFYEPSTRTRLSFESATQRLGVGIISTENAKEFSSAIKGESIEDSTKVLGGYADLIIMRHHETGAADRAAAVSTVPIINAGDGKGEHPTQALLDLYTIKNEKDRLNDLHVVIGGDLAHGRTARSLAQMLSIYDGNRISFVSTPELQIGDDIKEHLHQQGVEFNETDDMFAAMHDADVVYWTRLQKERLADRNVESSFQINQAALQTMPENAIILHPLPRVDEIETSVDADPRAAYFRQAHNGLFVRMALIDELLTSS